VEFWDHGYVRWQFGMARMLHIVEENLDPPSLGGGASSNCEDQSLAYRYFTIEFDLKALRGWCGCEDRPVRI